MSSPANVLLVTYSGAPGSMNRFIPDPGLALLAGYLTDAGARVEILDFNSVAMFRRFIPTDGIQEIRAAERNPVGQSDAVGAARRAVTRRHLDNATRIMIDTIHGEVTRRSIDVLCFKPWIGAPLGVMNQVLTEVKARCPRLIVSVGGPSVTALGESILPYLSDAVDLATFGPAEGVLPLLAHIARRPDQFANLPRTWRREAGAWVAPTPVIEGAVARRRPIYDPAVYPAVADGLLPAFVIENQRGCAMKCPFCTHPAASGGSIHRFSAADAFDEILDLHRQFGARAFRFSGSCSTPSFFTAFAEHAERHPTSFLFSSFFHPEHLERVDMARLIRAGWRAITLGIEAVDDANQRAFFNKTLDLKVLDRFESTHAHTGVYVALSLIYPALFDCAEPLRQFLNRYPIPRDRTSLALFYPVVYPGTSWWNDRARFGISLTDDAAYLREIVLNESLLPPFKRGGLSLGEREDGVLRRQFADAQAEQARLGISRMVPDEIALLAAAAGEKPNDFHSRTMALLDHFDGDAFAEEFVTIRRRLVEPREGKNSCPPS